MQFGLLHRSGEARTALDNVRPSRARSGVARTQPFDADRVSLFESLHGVLAGYVPKLRSEPADPERVFAFFEAYFSNFIEGTEFEVEEAEEIVFGGVVPDERPEDAHDILGTFRVVTDPELRAPLSARTTSRRCCGC